MPVDLDAEFVWPIFRLTYATTDDSPVVTPVASVPTVGDQAMVPELQVIGTSNDGVVGVSLITALAVSRSGAGPLLVSLFSLSDTFGTGAPVPTVSVSGDDIVITTTGLTATNMRWLLYWRLLEQLQ